MHHTKKITYLYLTCILCISNILKKGKKELTPFIRTRWKCINELCFHGHWNSHWPWNSTLKRPDFFLLCFGKNTVNDKQIWWLKNYCMPSEKWELSEYSSSIECDFHWEHNVDVYPALRLSLSPIDFCNVIHVAADTSYLARGSDSWTTFKESCALNLFIMLPCVLLPHKLGTRLRSCRWRLRPRWSPWSKSIKHTNNRSGLWLSLPWL